MCDSWSDKWAPVNRFACLCVCGVLQLLTLQTCSCSLLETFRCSTPMWAQMICVYAYLQSLHAASSACFTMLWKSVSNQFSPLSQSGGVDYWQQVVFGKKKKDLKKSQIAFMLFQQQSERLRSTRSTPSLHQHTVLGELGHLSVGLL